MSRIDIKMRHLYEVAVITSYTAKPRQTATGGAREAGSTTPCQQDARQQVAQLYRNHDWTHALASWDFPTGQGDNVLASVAPVSATKLFSEESLCVENAPSVSNFTSQESVSSWGTDAWSRTSQESLGDLQNDGNYDLRADYADMIFIPAHTDVEEFWKLDDASVFPHCATPNEEFVTHGTNFDMMLTRVAQDLTSLNVNPAEATPCQVPTLTSEMYGDTFGANQTFSNGSQNLDIDGANQKFNVYQDLLSGPAPLVCDAFSTGKLETDHGISSISDSGLVSRSSSLTSLVPTSSNVSEDNLADMESSDSITELRVKRMKPKLKDATLPLDMYLKSLNQSVTTSKAKFQPVTSGFDSTNYHNARHEPGSYMSTSGYSESVASYSVSSDSEMFELKPCNNGLNVTPWTNSNLANFQHTPSILEPVEDFNSSAWKPDDSMHQNPYVQFDSSAWKPYESIYQNPYAQFDSSSAWKSDDSIYQNSFVQFDSSSAWKPGDSIYQNSNTQFDSPAAWRPDDSIHQNPYAQFDSSAAWRPDDSIHQNPYAQFDSSAAWRPDDSIHQNLYAQFDSSAAWRPDVDLKQNSHNGFPLWDSGIENTGNLTNPWTTFNKTAAALTCTTFNNSTRTTEHPPCYTDQSCNLARGWYTNPSRKFSARQQSPYNCCLDHGCEFIPIQDLDVHMLPLGYQGWTNFSTILEISYRVVKLRVNKPFNMMNQVEESCPESTSARPCDETSDEPLLDHYGTGFACHIDKETIVIRTHSALVGSSLEASNTEVVFFMTFPNGQSQEITCTGLPDGFSSNDYSQITRFTCKTPPDLILYLHLFRDIPVVRRTSLFNDSCYFTDSSPDTSASGQEELENVQNETSLCKDSEENINRVQSSLDLTKETNVAGYSLTRDGNTCLYSRVLASQNEPSPRQTIQQSSGYIDKNAMANMQTERLPKSDCATNKQPDVELCDNNPAAHEHKADASFIPAVNNAFLSPPNKVLALRDDTRSINSRTKVPLDRAHISINSRTHVPLDRACQSTKDSCNEHINSNIPNIAWQNFEQLRPTLSRDSNCLRLQQPDPLPSPLVIMEKRYDGLNAVCGTRVCPYAEQNVFGRSGAYKNFSSLAGDVFSSFSTPGTTHRSDSEAKGYGNTNKWEYERLIFLQSHQRQSYNNFHKPASLCNPVNIGESQSASSQNSNGHVAKLSTDETSVGITELDVENKTIANDELSTADISTRDSTIRVEHNKLIVDSDSSKLNTKQTDALHSFKPKDKSLDLLKVSDASSGSISGSNRGNIFAEFSSTKDYLDTWDRDLLNLDTDLNPLPDVCFNETMIDNLLQHSDKMDRGQRENLTPVCCPQDDDYSKRSSDSGSGSSDGHASFCLIISHPHGGPKMLSTGFFSRHHHVGGILYDTPTCMGSCGAPVVALTENMESPYLTHFVHSGTVKVNSVPVGAGVTYFDRLPSLL